MGHHAHPAISTPATISHSHVPSHGNAYQQPFTGGHHQPLRAPAGPTGNDDNLYLLSQKHEQIIAVILAEEEDTINSHRQHIDELVELVKQEMMLLHEVDKPGSDVDEYVTNLDAILTHKLEVVTGLKSKLQSFKSHLKAEEELSKKFYDHRNEVLDVFDLENNNLASLHDVPLLNNLPH